MFVLALIALNLASNAPSAPEPAVFDSGTENQAGLTFSPDGRTAWWSAWDGRWGKAAESRRIYTSQWSTEGWSTPVPAPFSGEFDDDDPFVSPGGEWLYFVSTRPSDAVGPESQGDIWRYRLRAPNRLERLSVNSDATEYSPVVTSSGALYFASAREGGYGQGDLYRAPPLEGGFAKPEILGPALNHPTGEWNLWVAADEQEIIFEASSRPENVSTPGDLYYSWLTASGWSPAMPIAELNSEGSELMPRLHPDGRQLYYTSAPMGGHARIMTANWPRLREGLRSRHAPDLLAANRSSHDVAVFEPVSRTLAVSNTESGSVTLIEIDTGNTRVVALGRGSEGALAVGERIWVANGIDGTLSIVDAVRYHR